MKIIGVIPARYKSSRFPGKPLVDILGKPLVQRVYDRAVQSRLLNDVVVATEDERIERFCPSQGIKTVMTSDRHPTGTDRMSEVAGKIRADIYVNIQGDEPLISPDSINAVVKGFRNFRTSTAACLMKRLSDPAELININVPKVVVNDNGEAVFFSRLPIPFPKGGGAVAHYKQVCVYAFSRNTLRTFSALPQSRNELVEEIELLRLIDNRVPLKMIEVYKDNIAVDVPGDVQRVCKALKNG
jgi:3-deoxy-manno-octulosonate cytidylyltransferase (CMP-KDO synthetase)